MAFSVVVNAKGLFEPPSGGKEDARYAPWPTSTPYRWAHVTVTADTTSYAAGGLALDVLGQLSWTKIVSNASAMFTMNTALSYAKLQDENNGTAGSRKIMVFTAADGAEHATSACSAVSFDMWLTGY